MHCHIERIRYLDRRRKYQGFYQVYQIQRNTSCCLSFFVSEHTLIIHIYTKIVAVSTATNLTSNIFSKTYGIHIMILCWIHTAHLSSYFYK